MKYIWLVLAACGGSPAPQPVVANQPQLEPTSCRDASVLLRGPVTSDDPKAGPAREDAIMRSCTVDHWPASMLACVGSSRAPQECLTKLTDQQQDSYNAKIGTWEAEYHVPTDDTAEGPAHGDTDCADVAIDVSRYAPPIDTEKDWQTPRRAKLIEAECRDEGWAEDIKDCLVAARDISGTTACIQRDAVLAKLTQALDELDAKAKKIAAAKKQPATITCAKVVAVHYADAKWKTPSKDKAASRTAMQKACTAEKWSDTQRACIVTGDEQRCYDNPMVWSYPALAIVKQPNVPEECAVYLALMKRVTECPSIPEASRDALKDAVGQVDKAWASLSPDEAAQLGPICKSGSDAMQTAFPSCNGW